MAHKIFTNFKFILITFYRLIIMYIIYNVECSYVFKIKIINGLFLVGLNKHYGIMLSIYNTFLLDFMFII